MWNFDEVVAVLSASNNWQDMYVAVNEKTFSELFGLINHHPYRPQSHDEDKHYFGYIKGIELRKDDSMTDGFEVRFKEKKID